MQLTPDLSTIATAKTPDGLRRCGTGLYKQLLPVLFRKYLEPFTPFIPSISTLTVELI